MLFARLLENTVFDAVLERDSGGTAITNVPLRIRQHSGGRFDWGRQSPETNELALNLLDWWFPYSVDEQVPVSLPHGICSQTAWRYHRVFAQEFLVPAPLEGATVKFRHAHTWVAGRSL